MGLSQSDKARDMRLLQEKESSGLALLASRSPTVSLVSTRLIIQRCYITTKVCRRYGATLESGRPQRRIAQTGLDLGSSRRSLSGVGLVCWGGGVTGLGFGVQALELDESASPLK